MKNVFLLLVGLVGSVAGQTSTTLLGNSTGGNGSTDANKVPKYDPYGYLHAKRFAVTTGTGGTLSTENAFTDARSITILATTATLTAASDLVTTATAHGRQVGDAVVLTTSGSLSGTGITAGTVYFVRSVPATTTLTLTTAPGGSLLDLTGAGTGTHTITSASPHGFSDERTFLGASGLTTDAMNSFDGIPNIGSVSGTGTFNHYAWGQNRPKFYQSTSIGYGYMSAPEIFAGTSRDTVISTYRHIAIADIAEQTVAGSPTRYGYCTTQYGMHIYALANADNNVSIQSDGANARMIHNGRVVLGTNSYSGLDANSHFHVLPQANMRGLYVSGYSLTSSNAYSAAELAGTWNTSGTPTAVKVNITDTASNAASLLMDLLIGGTSKMSVSKGGTVTMAGSLVVTNSTTPASAAATGTAGTIAWDSSYIYVCVAANTWKRVAIATW